MRRILSVALGILLLLCASGAGVYAVEAEVKQAEKGYAVVFSGSEGMCAGTLTVSYDAAAFSLTDCSVGDALRGAMIALNPRFREDAIRLSWVSAEPISAAGEVLNIIGVGISPHIESLRISDADGRPMQVYTAKVEETQAPVAEPAEGESAAAGNESDAAAAFAEKAADIAADGGGAASGGSGAATSGVETSDPAITKAERQKHLIMLATGNATALFEGKRIAIDPGNSAVKPYLKGNRTFVPLRCISEAFGAQVDWLKDANEAKIVLDGVTVIVRIGENAYSVNGESKRSDAASELYGDRTFVPVRFIAEALGRHVYWEDEMQIVIISDTEWLASRSAEKEVFADAIEMFKI
jgi:hypothetical protein